MPVVTISRGSYNKGKEVAEALAEKLGCECLSRDLLLETSDQFNIPEIRLVKALHDAPSVLDRFSHGKTRYIACFRAAFLNHICKGDVVYHGLGGHFFLQNIPGVLKTKINARMEDRILDEMRREGCTRETARTNLRRDDTERRKWGLQLYGFDPWDARLYDLVCTVDTLGVDDVVRMLSRLCRLPQFQQSRKSLEKLRKEARRAGISAHVFEVAPTAAVTFLSGKKICLSGVKNSRKLRHRLEKELAKKFAVEEVIFKKISSVTAGHINTFHNLG